MTPRIKKMLEGFDASLDSFVQLNSSKVPAQENVYSLLISTGGTGLDALLEAKGLINKTCCLDDSHRDQPTSHVAYLAFDTDNKSLSKSSSRQTGGAMLDATAGEFVQMTAPNIAAFLEKKNRKQVPEYVSSWLDFSIDPNHNGTSGAGGIRQCGRLLLFQNIERVCNAIKSAIRGLVADKTVVALNVYLLCGIAGGTGSGTFLDLAYIARNEAEKIAPAKVTMFGYLFMPDVNLSQSMPEENVAYSKKNGYAALKELDYLMNMHNDAGRFVQRYSKTYVIDTERSPFNYVHLVSGVGDDGRVLSDPYRQGMRSVAQSIVSFVAEEEKKGVETKFAMSSHYDNIAHATEQHDRVFPERRNSYLALGSYSYELPIDQILLYVTSLLFEKMDSMFTCEPTQEDIDKAYAALELAPRTLLSRLAGPGANLSPANVTWEDLFGKSPRYDLVTKCDRWIDMTTLDVQKRAADFLERFPEKFTEMSRTWFTDPDRGPIWVNHLIVINKEDCRGLHSRLDRDYNAAISQATKARSDIGTAHQELLGALQEAKSAGILGNREGKKNAFIEKLNSYANQSIRLVALLAMQDLLPQCRDVILEENKRVFHTIVEVLEGLKDVCKQNTDILTRTKTEKDDAGTRFTWQPLRIPDVSDTIRKAFDAKGTATETITRFSREVYGKAYEWANGNIDMKTFIRDYLDENLGDIANRSLEEYIQAALKGDDLQDSVLKDLGPKVTKTSVPLFAKSQNADVGGKYWMLSVPYRCQKILQAFKTYLATEPDIANAMTIQSSGINSRIFAQSILSAVPLAAYAPLADYELAYLGNNGNSGKHLYMGAKEDWANLPAPIPYRSRPNAMGMYPPAIEKVENEQRALFRRCRELPIIRANDDNGLTVYRLHIAEMPDLEKLCHESALQDEHGRLDAGRLQEVRDMLEDWLTHGLPDQEVKGGIVDATYKVARCAVPEEGEKDGREEEAQECFLGEYNNIRRARKELEKYNQVQRKKEEIEQLYRQTTEMAQRTREIVYLLISGTVKMIKGEDGDASYHYYLDGRDRLLVKIGDQKFWREAVLSGAVKAMAQAEEPMKRQRCARILDAARTAYNKMDAALETAEIKQRKLDALSKGVEDRRNRVNDDVMDGIAGEGVDRETVSFYNKLAAQINREKRNIADTIKDLQNTDTGDGEYDEF